MVPETVKRRVAERVADTYNQIEGVLSPGRHKSCPGSGSMDRSPVGK